MITHLFTHAVCLEHDNGPGHPESPERLVAILAELAKPDYAALIRHEAPRATLDQIARVHEQDYIDRIFTLVPQSGRVALDGETSLTPQSGEAALRAAGAVVAAVDTVHSTKSTNAFCAIRPPGHHAAIPPASGFCLFNNIAIGAAHAKAQHGAGRIAIIDFDVHHGNSTQVWAETQDGVLFISSHQLPLWPGSGRSDECGPKGNIINIPLSPGADGAVFRQAMQNIALPAITDYRPDLIMISAGFDAHASDPLANLRLIESDYAWITSELLVLANIHCAGRIVSTLEGGYDVDALAASVGAHVKALMTI
jgi:acetoin utilization deacetylase AcuC-like enzyme